MKQKYKITILGHLSSQWKDVFEGMEVTALEDGNTLITGEIVDQSSLYGLIMRLRDLGMTLVSVTPSSEEIQNNLQVQEI